MRPRSSGRGDILDGGIGGFETALQRGRTLRSAEDIANGKAKGTVMLLQRSRALRSAEMRSADRRDNPRQHASTEPRSGEAWRSSWSIPNDRRRVASTEPRSEKRGNSTGGHLWPGADAASTEPRFEERRDPAGTSQTIGGVLLQRCHARRSLEMSTRCSRKTSTSSFNGATLGEAWRSRHAVPLVHVIFASMEPRSEKRGDSSP